MIMSASRGLAIKLILGVDRRPQAGDRIHEQRNRVHNSPGEKPRALPAGLLPAGPNSIHSLFPYLCHLAVYPLLDH